MRYLCRKAYATVKIMRKSSRNKVERKVRGMQKENLRDYTRIVVETDEENPITIADVTVNEIQVADGYRVRLAPQYN